jgi:hypothetical protein
MFKSDLLKEKVVLIRGRRTVMGMEMAEKFGKFVGDDCNSWKERRNFTQYCQGIYEPRNQYCVP